MADQKLVIHHITFVVNNFSTSPKKRGILIYFYYFFKQAWFFGIVCRNLQKDSSKNEDLKNFEM